jgi:hypothetical protein
MGLAKENNNLLAIFELILASVLSVPLPSLNTQEPNSKSPSFENDLRDLLGQIKQAVELAIKAESLSSHYSALAQIWLEVVRRVQVEPPSLKMESLALLRQHLLLV